MRSEFVQVMEELNLYKNQLNKNLMDKEIFTGILNFFLKTAQAKIYDRSPLKGKYNYPDANTSNNFISRFYSKTGNIKYYEDFNEVWLENGLKCMHFMNGDARNKNHAFKWANFHIYNPDLKTDLAVEVGPIFSDNKTLDNDKDDNYDTIRGYYVTLFETGDGKHKNRQGQTIDNDKENYKIYKLNDIDGIYGYVNELLFKISRNMKSDVLFLGSMIELLKSCKNLIFTGAPGTGKTYLAKQIAKQMIGVTTDEDEELEQSEQYASVQFHPSYDYTDFVEGLRPTKPDNNGNIGFELKDGIFKKFCFNALQNLEDSKKNKEELNEEELLKQKYNTLIDQIQNGEVDKLPLKTSSMYAKIFGISDNGNILFKKPNTGFPSSNTVSFARLKKLAKEYRTKEELDKISNIDKGIRKIIGGCNTTWFWSVLHYIYDKYGNQIDTQPIELVKPKKYVFVIDEINRGEISKIFGELFFSIDPNYRGRKGAVKTQYSNMHEDSDDDFYVPENVYIIGTMNDIDRSVESFDFAMRRRFTWKEITAEQSVESMKLPKEIKDKMANLNTKISDTDGLNASYHIGGAYFLDANGKPRADYETIWEFRLEPLLKEYLRGMSDVEKKLKLEDMKKAYYVDIDKGQ
jgi:hypothetical protein